MKFTLFSCALLMIVITGTAQVTTAENGLYTPNATTVRLGGTLLETTNIDLGSGFNFNFMKSGNNYFSILNNGNIGIGTTSPGARLAFPNVDEINDPIGLTWFNPSPLLYGIYRTAGTWSAPDYQQLKMMWNTGIVLDPGTAYGKCYVDIAGNGLRVTSGNVGIGITNPVALLSLGGSVGNAKLALWEGESGGGVGRMGFGVASGQFRMYLPGSDNRFSFLSNEAGTNELMTVLGTGNVGIGTATPAEKLDVSGNVKATGLILPTGAAAGKVLTSDANGNATWQTATGSSAGWAFGGNPVAALTSIGTSSNYDLPIVTNNTERMRIGANGNIGIGTVNINDLSYKLFVEGNIRTRKIRVDHDSWPDYVFDYNYQLTPLKEVEQYIQQQKHLPEVPSAAEVKKEGVDLGNNQAILLKKVEELTLYIIQQQKQLETQQKRIEMLEKKVAEKK